MASTTTTTTATVRLWLGHNSRKITGTHPDKITIDRQRWLKRKFVNGPYRSFIGGLGAMVSFSSNQSDFSSYGPTIGVEAMV